MTDEHDWQAAYRLLAEQEYARNEEPPTVEEIEACFSGKPDDDADRIRERLAFYPELARVMTTPIPDAGDDSLTERQLDEDWRRLRATKPAQQPADAPLPEPIPFSPGPRPVSTPLIYGVAAVLALAIVGIYLWMTQRPRPGDEISRVARILLPDGMRGGGQQLPIPLPTAGRYDLKLVLYEPIGVQTYRVRIVSLTDAHEVWRLDSLHRATDGSVTIAVSSRQLRSGTYRIEIYDEQTIVKKSAATYTVSVPKP